MSPRRFGRRSTAAYLARGWRRCHWGIIGPNRLTYTESEETGARCGVQVRNDQCRNWVSPDQIKRMGRPICPAHAEHFRETSEAWDEVRRCLRRRYDPGPLPLPWEEEGADTPFSGGPADV